MSVQSALKVGWWPLQWGYVVFVSNIYFVSKDLNTTTLPVVPIERDMSIGLSTIARSKTVHCLLVKATLLGVVAWMLIARSALAQVGSETFEPSMVHRINTPQTKAAFELFGHPQNSNSPTDFYNFAFRPMPTQNQESSTASTRSAPQFRQHRVPVSRGLPFQTLGEQALGAQNSGVQTFGSQNIGAKNLGNHYFENTPAICNGNTSTPSSAVEPIFAVPSNRQSAGAQLLAPYQSRAASQGIDIDWNTASIDNVPVADQFRGWWASEVASPVGIGAGHIEVSVDMLIHNALRHSPSIQVAATAPHILQTSVFEASSAFDWTSFLESKYDSQNDPIGNTLTTGNNESRFKQQELSARGGLRRSTRNGGEFDISQRLGHLDNNSRFLVPRNQGSARLELNFRQPILNGRGRGVNQSMIVLADIDFRSASDDFLRELQLHLVLVTESYWELVRARAVYLQRKQLLQSAERILHNLEGRSQVDSLQRQILRAKAAVAQRRSEIARSLTSIKNAQSQLRLLVNSPDISAAGGVEFTPTDLPALEQAPLHIELADVMSTALLNRPDISRSIRDLHAANVRLGVARNEVLPKLDMILGTYLAGLDADSDIFDSWTNQFTRGAPGFNVGFEYEIPIGNRAANARRARRQWESTRALHLFRQTVETALTEVEVAAREVKTTYQEMLGRYHSMIAAERETSYLVDRWQTLPEVNDSVTLLLEDLLDSQERLADEESAFVSAQVQYSISIVQLKQAMGTLFRVGR